MFQAANITKERLASFDRPIRSEPSFKPEQKEGLLRDLTNYLQTLKAKQHNTCSLLYHSCSQRSVDQHVAAVRVWVDSEYGLFLITCIS